MDPTASLGEGRPHPPLGAVVHADCCHLNTVIRSWFVWQSSLSMPSPYTPSRAGAHHEHGISQLCEPDSQHSVGNVELSHPWIGTVWCRIWANRYVLPQYIRLAALARDRIDHLCRWLSAILCFQPVKVKPAVLFLLLFPWRTQQKISIQKAIQFQVRLLLLYYTEHIVVRDDLGR